VADPEIWKGGGRFAPKRRSTPRNSKKFKKKIKIKKEKPIK
jgi:hypothetical protein